MPRTKSQTAKRHPIYKAIGERIQKQRLSKNISAEVLGDAIKVGRTHIYAIEAGKSRIQIHQLLGIAERLKLPLKSLLRRV